MITPLMISVVVESPVPIDTRMEAALLWILCLVPAWSFLGKSRERRRPIPFIPMIGILYGIYFALPAALGAYNQHYRIVLSPRRDYDEAIFVALAGWIALTAGYFAASLAARPNRKRQKMEVPDAVRMRYGALLMVGGVLLESIRLVSNIPVEIAGILKFIGTLGWFGSGILIALLVQRRLPLAFRLLTYGGSAAFLLMSIGSGSVANAAFYGAVVIMSAWIGRGHVKVSWIVSAFAGLVLIIALRGVSDQYRKIVWVGGEGGGVVSRTKLFFKLLYTRVELNGVDGAIKMGFETSAGRSANLDLLADVIIRTPSEIPYWGGETYLSLAGAFVPRVLWPDKPTKELGQAFGHRYTYIGTNDFGTAMNLPVLVEFYANFGFIGVIFGMAIVGGIYCILEGIVNNPDQDVMLSLIGVVILVPLADIESDFSLGFGGLILNGAALWIVLRTIRRSGLRRDLQAGANTRPLGLTTAPRSS
ncbi:MAG: hypothetical protein ABI884_10135 [Gemmatimonadota bacterium]